MKIVYYYCYSNGVFLACFFITIFFITRLKYENILIINIKSNSNFFPLLGKGLLLISPFPPFKGKLTPAHAEVVHFISLSCFLSTAISLLVAWNPFCDSLSPSVIVGSLDVTSPLPLCRLCCLDEIVEFGLLSNP